MTTKAFLALNALLLLAGCNQTQSTPGAGAAAADASRTAPDEVSAAIQRTNEETGKLISAGKGNAVGDQYTEDGMLMPANAPVISGREAIGQQFQGTVDAGVRGLVLSATEVEASGDLAIEVGRYRATDANNAIMDDGKYVVIWKREDGTWKRYRDIFNTDRPATPAAEPANAAIAAPASGG